jgi:hypothetical protein
MTERKIVLYLEQETFFEHKKVSYPFLGDFWKGWNSSPDSVRLVTYEIYSSFNPILDKLFHDKGWNRSILINLRQKTINKIALLSWDISKKHLCNNIETIYPDTTKDFFSLTINDILIKNNICFILNIKAQEYHYKQRLSHNLLGPLVKLYKKDIGYFVNDQSFRSDKHKYRLYLNNRLLIERFYPVDIEHNRMLSETIYLKPNASGELRIESDFDLLIKRTEVDGRNHDIYNTNFTLPDPDK